MKEPLDLTLNLSPYNPAKSQNNIQVSTEKESYKGSVEPREEPIQTREPRVLAAPEPRAPTGQRPRLVVKGIVYSERNPSALIGTDIVHEGDTISGAQVVRIGRDSVEFSINGRTWRQGVNR